MEQILRKKPLPVVRSAVMATLVVAATAACLAGPAGTASPQGPESDQSPSGGSERAVPASITDRLKDGSAIAQAAATVIAIGVGGLFAWRNAQIFRARAPHVTISHEVSHRFVGTEYVHIAVTAILHNRSRVNIEFRDGLFIIQQIAPSLDEDVEELYASVFLDHEHEDLQWPTLEQARRAWDEDELIVEPRESETETFEFIVSTDVESIVITTYFYNSRVLGKIPDDIELREAPRLHGKLRRWRDVRGPRGWSRTTVYDILT